MKTYSLAESERVKNRDCFHLLSPSFQSGLSVFLMGCRIESFTTDAFRALPPPPPFHRCIIRFGSPMRNTFHRYVLSAENTFHQFSSFISWIHFSTPASYRKLLWVTNTRHFTYKCLIEGIYFCLRGAGVAARSRHLALRYSMLSYTICKACVCSSLRCLGKFQI